MDMQNPDEDMLPEELTGKASRLRKLAEILRKQQGPATAANTMVGGRYIAPNLASMLNPAVSMVRGHMADRQADGMEQQAARQAMMARQQFSQNIPQMQPGMPERPMQGPVDPEGGVPELGMSPPQAAQPVTRDMVLKHTLGGLANPSTAGMAKAYGDMALKGIDAADQREARAFEGEQNRNVRMDEGEANREARLELARERIAAAEAQGKDTRALRLQLGQMQAEAQKYSADRRFEGAALRASLMKAGKTAGGGAGKPLPASVHKELTGLETGAANMAGLAASFKSEYSTVLQGAKNTINAYNPLAKESAANQWWKDYAKRSSLKEAHDLFGASFTAHEADKWAAADIAPGMNPKLIMQNLAKREAQAKRLFANAVDRYSKEGHSRVDDAYDGDKPRGTEGVEKSPEDYLKQYLPPKR